MLIIREKNEITLFDFFKKWKKFQSIRSQNPYGSVDEEGYLTIQEREKIIERVFSILFFQGDRFSVAQDLCHKCQKSIRKKSDHSS